MKAPKKWKVFRIYYIFSLDPLSSKILKLTNEEKIKNVHHLSRNEVMESYCLPNVRKINNIVKVARLNREKQPHLAIALIKPYRRGTKFPQHNHSVKGRPRHKSPEGNI